MRTLFASWHRTLLCTLAMLAFVGGEALADVPTPPLLLGASVSFQGNDAYGTLGWYGNDSLNWNNNSYRVYQISGYDTTDTFTLVATITDTSIRGSYTMPLDPGVYTFYVTAFNDSGESPRSNYVSLVVPSMHITIDPNAVADSIEVGTPYSYQVHGQASDSSEIHYQIVNPQPGMTIDSLTGVFSWTPAYSGRYHIRIRAYSWPTWNTEASMWLSLFVRPQTPVLCATLYGSVSYSDNTPVLAGTVTAIPNDSLLGYTPTASIVNGAYELSVEGGISYRIQVNGDFYPETTRELYSAVCDSADSVPLIYVRHYLPQAYDTVSGYVLRLADGLPASSTVVFYRDSIGGYSRTTHTNGNGYYDIILDHGADSTLYYVRAIPDNNDLYEQYYYHASTAVSAIPIWVSGYRTNVNFDLEEREVFNNSLSGSLVNENNDPLSGTVVAYVITTRDSVQGIEYFNQTSVLRGAYSFSNLPAGTYILFGMAGDSDTYAPGYYLEDEFAAQSWELGTQITVTTTSHDSLLVIKLDSINGTEGRNLLRGWVTDNAGAAGRQGRILQGSKPLAGANVYAVDANNRISGYATTNQDGEFVISRLGVGVYQIVVDKIGYRGSVSIVTFTEDNTEKELPGVGLDRVGSTSSVPVVTGGASSLAVYPNPARGSVNISFTASYGHVHLTMTNAAGVEVRSGRLTTVDGANTVRLETDDLGSGLYFVRIAGDKGTATIPVTIVR